MAEEERIAFRSLPGVSGIEILDAENSSRNWKWFHTAFGLALMRTWHGEVTYRRRHQLLAPGTFLCTAPGEVHTAPRIQNAGSFQVLMIDAEVFRNAVAEHGKPRGRATWGKIIDRPSEQLVTRVAEISSLARPATEPMEAQCSVEGLFEQIATELVEQPLPLRPREHCSSVAGKMRECLHSEEGLKLDLNDLAAKFGLSRYQALRAFRTRYGLPPHAYQLCSRIAHARTLLHAGRSPTEVSAQCGFADQSHFGRHFKRLTGVTPAQYVAALESTRAKPSSRRTRCVPNPSLQMVTRV